ncbi:MAG: YfhO family protein [Candidatus Competibacteraceae bacterium]|nr:YfhO family protein [Candidatus Competibacteraceae bacterium]
MKQFMPEWKSVMPHALAVGIFLLISVVMSLPAFDGKVLSAHDDLQYRGSAKEVQDFRKQHGKEPLWTNSMFGGMPSYLITFKPDGNFIEKYIAPVFSLGLPRPANSIFIALLCFYLMMLTFRPDPWMGMLGALGFGLTTYHFIIMGAGHFNKMVTISYIPLVVAGINLVFDKKYIWGAIVAGLAMSLEMLGNHPQMTYYYFAFFLSIYLLYRFVDAIIQKQSKHALIAASIIGVMFTIGAVTTSNRLLPVNEYTSYSTRGKSELVRLKENSDKTSGLDKSYIVGYSYGKGDIFSMWIPNFKGPKNGVLYEHPAARESVKGNDREMLKSFDQYWGGQDASGGALYSGAIIFFLFILGIALVSHPIKWIVMFSVLLTLMLSWGKNYMGLTEFFINHFPLYNKFRAVNSILVVMEFTVPILAVFALYEITSRRDFFKQPFTVFKNQVQNLRNEHVLYGVFALTGIMALIAYLVPGILQSFFKPGEINEITAALTQQGAGQSDINRMLDVVETARISIFKADAIRTAIIISLGFALLFAYSRKKINAMVLSIGLIAITFVDLYTINTRYLTDKNYKKPTELIRPTIANQSILQDTDPNFRVANLSVSTFNDGITSYFHKSIGGYHGAKMERYQELIEFALMPDLNKIFTSKANSAEDMMEVFKSMQVANMLNTKYYIFSPEQAALPNLYAFGNAWMVNRIEWANDADEELEKLTREDIKQTAIVDKRYEQVLSGFTPVPDSSASIQLTSYLPNQLTYAFESSTEQFVVFSEIFYDKGWNAYIDDAPVEYVRANYVLRGMKIPAGKHTIEFDFSPASYAKGVMISQASSGILLLIMLVGFSYLIWLQTKKSKA